MAKLKKSSGVLSVMFLAMMVVGLAAMVIVIMNTRTPLLTHSKAACVPNSVTCGNSYNSNSCNTQSHIYTCYSDGSNSYPTLCPKGCHYASPGHAVCNTGCGEGDRTCGGTGGVINQIYVCTNDVWQRVPNITCTNGCRQDYGSCLPYCANVNPTPKPQPTSPPVNYTCGGKSYSQCSSGTCPKGQTCKKNDTKKICNCKSV